MEPEKHFEFHDAVIEAKNNFKSVIGKYFHPAEVQKIWDNVGTVIENILSQHKAVAILGLGTFTLSEWSLNTGLGKPLVISQPVFVMTEKLVKSFGLQNQHPYTSDKIPCYMLHHKTVEAVCKKKHKIVETCIAEVVQAFTRLLWQNKNVFLHLGDIGKLEVINKEVKMKFKAEFLERVMERVQKSREVEILIRPWSPKKILE